MILLTLGVKKCKAQSVDTWSFWFIQMHIVLTLNVQVTTIDALQHF